MKILYLSCHSVLEYDELSLLTELPGVEVFSLGAYMNPTQIGDGKRGVIPQGKYYAELYDIGMQCDKINIHPELLKWADVVISMHNPPIAGQTAQQAWLVHNWENFKRYNCKVIWRSIGQSTPSIEHELQKYRSQGLKIIRYSPIEDKIPNYAGSDALIRFYKDPEEFKDWTGETEQLITFTQQMKKRGDHVGYTVWNQVSKDFPAKIFGPNNEEMGAQDGGQLTYEEMKAVMRTNRVFFYFGTVPAPYTLSLMEAMMTGMPVVAAGEQLRKLEVYSWKNYEIPSIIRDGVNGFVANSIDELRTDIQRLLADPTLAQQVGAAARETAIALWGKQKIKKEWEQFLLRR